MSGIYRGPGSSVAAETVNLEGDKGDITVSNAGETWTIDSNAVTFSKIQNVATDTLLGRSTSGTGNVETITCTAAGRALLDDADAAAQRATLGITDLAGQDPSNVDITGGTISGLTVPLAVSDGGTGADNQSAARSNLGLTIGSNVLAYDANLQSFVNTFTLPTSDSTSGFYLKTDGAGNLGFQAPGGIADGDYGDITVSGGGAVWNIDADTITTTELANNAVETANITDLNVTTGKLADLAVTAGKLAADSVTTAKILDSNVTNAKLANGYINDLSSVTLDVMQDYVPVADASDSGNKKKVLLGAPYGYISGLVVTNNATDANNDLDISVGHCRNAANTLDVVLSSAITKRMDAAFSAGTGNGGLGNTVSKPTSGTLHIFVIYNTTTFAVDVYGDTSVSGANVPSGWAIGRRIASYRTDSSANFIAVNPIEIGGGAVWVAYNVQRSGDIADTSVSSVARETYSLTVPNGIRVLAKFSAQLLNPDSNGGLKFFDLATSDAAVALDAGSMSLGGSVASGSAITGVRYAGEFEVLTNTSGQIGARSIATGTDLYANTIGYTDFRRVA